ncbi:hypothetical protein Q5752_003318 [Cryptotrichosporon argae]
MSTLSDSALHALSGSLAGLLSMAATYPLVTLSTRASVATKAAGKDRAVSTLGALKAALARDGVRGLYAGLESGLVGIAVTNGVYYAFYEELRAVLLRRRPGSAPALSAGEGILAGLVAGSITTLTTNPIWVVQAYQSTRAEVAPAAPAAEEAPGFEVETKSIDTRRAKPSAVESARAIVKADGVKGLWRGIGPALVLVINPVIQYTTYERLVSLLLTYRLSRATAPSKTAKVGRAALSDWDVFVLGAASKLVATGGTYPYLVVKSRLQAATHKYKSSLKAVLHILQTEGLTGLYAGLGPKLLQSALTAAILFVAQRRIYDALKRVALAAAEKRGLAARA